MACWLCYLLALACSLRINMKFDASFVGTDCWSFSTIWLASFQMVYLPFCIGVDIKFSDLGGAIFPHNDILLYLAFLSNDDISCLLNLCLYFFYSSFFFPYQNSLAFLCRTSWVWKFESCTHWIFGCLWLFMWYLIAKWTFGYLLVTPCRFAVTHFFHCGFQFVSNDF